MAGTFNQSLQCTQDVFVGFQVPSPPVVTNPSCCCRCSSLVAKEARYRRWVALACCCWCMVNLFLGWWRWWLEMTAKVHWYLHPSNSSAEGWQKKTSLGGRVWRNRELRYIGLEVVVTLVWVFVLLSKEMKGRVENKQHVQGDCSYIGCVGKMWQWWDPQVGRRLLQGPDCVIMQMMLRSAVRYQKYDDFW